MLRRSRGGGSKCRRGGRCREREDDEAESEDARGEDELTEGNERWAAADELEAV